jgi:hypothetical protein
MSEFDVRRILATFAPEFHHPLALEPLTQGQSSAWLYRLAYAWGTTVLKGPLQAREYAFYREVAPRLETLGVAVPHIMGWGEVEGERWVLREAFAALLPSERRVADHAVLATLHQLHALPVTFPIPCPFVPQWQTIAAPYQLRVPAQTLDYLSQLGACHRQLFIPQCVIAGDPNAENWGLRSDGTVVLFDWDCIGYGTPARDLAVIVPGLGWPTLFQQVAAAYLAATPGKTVASINQLAHDMIIAKAQVLAEYINAPAIVDERRQTVCALMPSWVEMMWQMDERYHEEHRIS